MLLKRVPLKVADSVLTQIFGRQFGRVRRCIVNLLCVIFCFMPFSVVHAEDETVMELESYIVGDKEQPAVSYFVPWQGTGAPDKLHWNIEDKNDKTLDLVDRDVMLRSIDIYNEMDLEQMPVE